MEAVQVLSQLKHIKSYVKLVYKSCVESVNPNRLIYSELIRKDNTLVIKDNEYPLRKNCYVVGFGKAVLDMAVASDDILAEHICDGAISVPEGLLSERSSLPKHIHVYEGAKGNIPDEKALLASKTIVKIAEELTASDLLLVLISGGGSALFPYPVPPITLAEKRFITETLMKAGANIVEVNAVRKRLSLVKGGGLAKIAYPATVVALVLSDVVNDPLSFIASGPTVPDQMPQTLATEVLKKYDLMKIVPSHVLDVLQKVDTAEPKSNFSSCRTYIIGNNNNALNAGAEMAFKDGFASKVMTNCLEGETKLVAESFAKLSGLLCQALGKTITMKLFTTELYKISKELCVSEYAAEDLAKLVFDSSNNKICLLFGGETTLKVTGTGKGGRNQELALRFSTAIDDLAKTLHVIDLFNVVMLCAGSDGIDGPTDAAGAIGYNGQSKAAFLQKLNVEDFALNNNSYVYYSLLDNGDDLFKCGFTGTNVMDINILTVQSKV